MEQHFSLHWLSITSASQPLKLPTITPATIAGHYAIRMTCERIAVYGISKL
jgi:hypothetical protein